MGMKIYTPDKSELMDVTSIRREGAHLLVSGKIMGSLPMKAVLRPQDARKGLKLLNFETIAFLVTFLFRKG